MSFLQVCSITYARIQGKNAMVAHFQNSSLLHEDKRCRPVLFRSEGPLAGVCCGTLQQLQLHRLSSCTYLQTLAVDTSHIVMEIAHQHASVYT